MEHAGFTTLDCIVLGVILVSGLLAILTGLIREIWSLFNWIASYFVAVHYYPLVLPLVKRYISNHTTADDVSIFIVFCLCFIILGILGSFLTGLVKGKTLTAIDRSLGFVFGLIRGYLIVCLIYLVASSVLWPDIDKVLVATASSSTPEGMTGEQPLIKPDSGRQQLTMAAPQWLMDARLRPLMARGAGMLREFIPDKLLEKTTQDALSFKDKAKEKLDQEKDKLSSPGGENPHPTVNESKP